MIEIRAPAKVNLALRVLAREESGYHQLETLFSGLEFGDTLSVAVRGSGISLEVDGPRIGPPEENLVYRAAQGFLDLSGGNEGLDIRLGKRIPLQAGLGGGSSDAGATLRALSALFPGRVSPEDLMELAGRLGSDVPFFLSPSPLCLAWGRGDRLLPLPTLPRAPVVLAVPPMGVSTPEAFEILATCRAGGRRPKSPGLHTLSGLESWVEVAAQAENDFESTVFDSFPILGEILRAMEEAEPRMALLSGSGSTLFAVFEKDAEAEAGAERLRAEFEDTRFIVTHTLTEFPDPNPYPGVE